MGPLNATAVNSHEIKSIKLELTSGFFNEGHIDH